MVFTVWEALAPREHESFQSLPDAFYSITDMCWPFSHLLMLLVGMAVVRAKVWRGWRTWPAFLVGLALPSALIAKNFLHGASAMQAAGLAFGCFTLLGFTGHGIALLSSHLQPAAEPQLIPREA